MIKVIQNIQFYENYNERLQDWGRNKEIYNTILEMVNDNNEEKM